MPRLLAIGEQRVALAERDAYLASLAERRANAAAAGLNFWVFEHLTEPGRFIEFTEGADAEAIRRRPGADPALPLWQEVQGG